MYSRASAPPRGSGRQSASRGRASQSNSSYAAGSSPAAHQAAYRCAGATTPWSTRRTTHGIANSASSAVSMNGVAPGDIFGFSTRTTPSTFAAAATYNAPLIHNPSRGWPVAISALRNDTSARKNASMISRIIPSRRSPRRVISTSASPISTASYALSVAVSRSSLGRGMLTHDRELVSSRHPASMHAALAR